MVNAESDFLSGLIVDKYEDVLVVQISSLGMDKRKKVIIPALENIFKPRAILERSDVASRKFEGLEEANGVLAGEPVERIRDVILDDVARFAKSQEDDVTLLVLRYRASETRAPG